MSHKTVHTRTPCAPGTLSPQRQRTMKVSTALLLLVCAAGALVAPHRCSANPHHFLNIACRLWRSLLALRRPPRPLTRDEQQSGGQLASFSPCVHFALMLLFRLAQSMDRRLKAALRPPHPPAVPAARHWCCPSAHLHCAALALTASAEPVLDASTGAALQRLPTSRKLLIFGGFRLSTLPGFACRRQQPQHLTAKWEAGPRARGLSQLAGSGNGLQTCSESLLCPVPAVASVCLRCALQASCTTALTLASTTPRS